MVLQIGFWAISLMPLVWLMCTTSNYRYIIPCLYGVAALFWSGIGLAQYNLLLELVPATANAKYFSISSLVGGVMGTAGSMLAGYFVKNGPSLGFIGSAAKAFFVLCILAVIFRISSAILIGGVKEPVLRPKLELFTFLDKLNPFSSKG
jgi:hypothetical protein